MSTILRATIEVPPTADIAAIVLAAGGDLTKARYSSGTNILMVPGIEQAALEAAASPADSLYGDRVLIKQAAQAELDRRIEAGLPWMGKVVQIDDASTGRMTAVSLGAREGAIPAGIAWRMADNTSLILDADGIVRMAVAALGYVVRLRMRYWQIVDAAKAAPDADALAEIDPLASWPQPPPAEPAAP